MTLETSNTKIIREGIEGRGTIGTEGQHAGKAKPANNNNPTEQQRSAELWSEDLAAPDNSNGTLSKAEQIRRNNDLW